MQTRSGAVYNAMANEGNNNDDERRLTHRVLRDNQKRAEETAKIIDLKNGKLYHSFIRQVELGIKLFTNYCRRIEPHYEMPDELKCEFLYSHLGDEPSQWFNLAQAQNEALLENWTALKAAVAAKYRDPNRAFKAFNEFMDLKMGNSLDTFENKFASLLDEMEDSVPAALQVKYYLRGLRQDIQVKVLSHFVTSQTTYELQAAKQQARVFFESMAAPTQPPSTHRGASGSATAAAQRVRFQTNSSGANNYAKESGPMMRDYIPFAADQNLSNGHRLVKSGMYPDYWPTTLAGKLGSPDATGTPGHKLRMFLGANNMCNLCRFPGHHVDQCTLNKSPKLVTGN